MDTDGGAVTIRRLREVNEQLSQAVEALRQMREYDTRTILELRARVKELEDWQDDYRN